MGSIYITRLVLHGVARNWSILCKTCVETLKEQHARVRHCAKIDQCSGRGDRRQPLLLPVTVLSFVFILGLVVTKRGQLRESLDLNRGVIPLGN